MNLNFCEQGSGPPLIILHGLFGSLENWAFIAQQLASEFRVFTVDQRNHGRSPHSDEMNFPALAEDLLEFISQQQLQRVHVLGHSMGGKAAMEFALSHAARLDKLIVVDIAPRAYGRRHDNIFNALLALELESFATRGELEKALEPSIPDLAVRRFLLKGLAQDALGQFRWRFNLRALHERYGELNAPVAAGRRCDAPALFIRGSDSDYITGDDWADIKALFPRAELATIESAGHWVHAEQAEIFLDHTRRFLRGNF